MRLRPSGRLLVGALVAATLAVHLLLAHVLDREFDHGARAAQEAERSHRVRAALLDVLSLHQDVETGQRGYLLTRDPRFLQPYREARAVSEAKVDALSGALEPGSPLTADMARLRALSRAKLDFADATVALEAEDRPEDARAAVASGRGKALMDAIRARIADMDRTERARLAERTAEEFAAHARTRTLSLLLLAGLAAMLTVAAAVIARAWGQRRRLHTRLRDAAARQQAILDSTTDAIISLNPSGSIESLNRAARAMFGYREDELLRRDVSVLFEIAPERGRTMPFIERLGLDEAAGRTIDITGRRSDGAALPTEVAVSPMHLPSGVHAVAVVRDATERHRVDAMKREFISTVSHELRTPLTSIAGSLGLLTGGAAGPLPERAGRLVGIAHANSERLVRLVNDILDIEKIEAGETQFDIRALSLADLLGRTVDANGGYAHGFGVRLELAPVDDEAHVLGDPDRLQQVFTNLLSNACKFSPAGGRVLVMASALDGCWRVSVSDEGPGIPPAFQSRLFDKFTQADGSDTRAKGGSGLGLSIVREIVARHDGRVSFDTDEGRGTTFHVDLPRADEPMLPPAPASVLPRVLHVEDDVDMTRVVASALEGRAALVPAHSLRRARELLAAERFDLVILDIGLADGCGLDLLDAEAPPVIVFTAQEAGAPVAHRARAVLVKSRASIGRLVAAVDEALKFREAA